MNTLLIAKDIFKIIKICSHKNLLNIINSMQYWNNKDFYTQIDKFFDLWNSSNRLWIIIDETHNINVKLDESNLIHFLYLEKLNQRLSPTTLLKQIKKSLNNLD